VNDVLDSTFGDSDDGESQRLRAGLVGLAADHRTQTLVVTVDPALVDEAALQRQLDAALGAIPLRVQVGPSCNSAADLVAAEAVLESASWYPRGTEADGPISYFLDDLTSTWNVALSEADRDLGGVLQATLGDAVNVSYGELGQATRLRDPEPHWGGAGIAHPRTRPRFYGCGSAFTAVLPNGRRGAVTAGHCFVGDVGKTLWSGPRRYGIVGKRATYPRLDMRRIRPGHESFARRIYTSPPGRHSRVVRAANNPDEQQFVCLSGVRSRRICGVEIVNRDARLCLDPGNPRTCTRNLVAGRRGGDTVARPGDSGGPVYTARRNRGAAIRGMIIGYGDFGDTVLFHNVGTIKEKLGVRSIAR
jgi:hypothetical protein